MPLMPSNDKAHAFLSELLNEAEEWAVRNGYCEAINAHEFWTLQYIETCGEMLTYTQVYLENEERVAARVFLYNLNRTVTMQQYSKRFSGAALQLATHTHYYFPNFVAILRLSYLNMLREAKDASEIQWHGITRLAVAVLPGARDDARREIRRRGGNPNALLITDDTHNRIMGKRIGMDAIPKLALKSLKL
jgi:hypothetical protein